MEEIYISMPRHNGELVARKAYYDFLRTVAIPAATLRPGLPAIKNVIFNPPATVVFWSDNTKTVVKADKEMFDPEKGLAMAISKKALGNKGNYFNEIKKWVEKYDTKSDYPEVTIARLNVDVSASFSDNFKKLKESAQKMGHAVRDLRTHTKRWLAYHRLCNAIGDKKATKADLIAAMHEAADYLEDNTDE